MHKLDNEDVIWCRGKKGKKIWNFLDQVKCPIFFEAFPYLSSKRLSIVPHGWTSSDFHLRLICGTEHALLKWLNDYSFLSDFNLS